MEPMKIKTILPYAATSMVIFLIAGIIGFATGVAYLTAPHTDKVPSVNNAVQTYKQFKEAQIDPLAKLGPLVKAAVISMSNSYRLTCHCLRIYNGKVFRNIWVLCLFFHTMIMNWARSVSCCQG
jgi:hypothetical protein